jgi:glycolate oxidase FAD binding subunit
MMGALRSTADVSGAAYVPDDPPPYPSPAARERGLSRESQTLLRIEGFGPSVEARARLFTDMVDRAVEHLEPASAAQSWSRIGSGSLVGGGVDDVLWRICIPATKGAALCAELRALGASLCVDWGGALIWATLNAEVAADPVRACAERAGGHATLMRAPVEFRSRIPALHPESNGVAALTQRVKAAFDPSGILDPSRFEVSQA